MGVPGLFSWLVKKYKNTNFVFTKNTHTPSIIMHDINNMDYLLIDANCLFHPECFKTIDENPNLDGDELEDLMMLNIINRLQFIIDVAKPNKGVYIAVDGVAPMAKLKQQQTRRYFSIYDKMTSDNIKRKLSMPVKDRWNNSAISPGTKFMNKLHLYILNWCKNLDINIIYSSYKIPGEGEHKLLQFIKDNNTKNKKFSYVLYGLDGDLIFLSLLSNSKIYLLREEVSQNKPNYDVLDYVSIDIMKDLIYETFNNIYRMQNYEHITLSKINIINDFIGILYLIGNDFLPCISSLSLFNNGVEYIIGKYIDTFYKINKSKKIHEYFIENKDINNNFLREFINLLCEKEEERLKSYTDKKKPRYSHATNKYEQEIFKRDTLQFDIPDPVKIGIGSFKEYRKRYYMHYWNLKEDEIEKFSKKLVKHYLYGMKWSTLYYFEKCPSWNWFYPFDQPPFLSDMIKYMDKYPINEINFKLGKANYPFVQLLLVLPIQSHYLLPDVLQDNIEKTKDIIYLYPKKFEVDFLYKYAFHKGTPILPDINIKLIKKYYNKYKKDIPSEELVYNKVEKKPFYNKK